MQRARSVSELLPRRFEDLTFSDVQEIVTRVGDPRETLFFERKLEVDGDQGRLRLAKSCAAFANTYGGVVLVGVRDEGNEIVGVAPIPDTQTWVKNTLRGHVLPLPPFRARWIPHDGEQDKGVLLVLVDESATTPHLLTRQGAIYVRNPGSSDPVPIGDQAQLLDLIRRGVEARDTAVLRAKQIAEYTFVSPAPFRLSLAPTGARTDIVRGLYQRELPLDSVAFALVSEQQGEGEVTRFPPVWSQRRLAMRTHVLRSLMAEPEGILDGIVVDHDCALAFQRGYLPERDLGDAEPRGARSVQLDEILSWFSGALARGRNLALELGAHGDLRLHLRLELEGRHVFYATDKAEKATRPIVVERWTVLDSNTETDAQLFAETKHDIMRSLGLPPATE